MASIFARTTNFSEEEKPLLAELGRKYPDMGSKGYDSNTLTRKQRFGEKLNK